MDIIGSEIGQKMRSAIKAKLTELGCYVDDELPDYVMVMVANKRTRKQMEDDLQLFLGDNTVLFVGWLHQVLKKLQEVTISTPAQPLEKPEKVKDKTEKQHKVKEKKEKSKSKHNKSDGSKKSKKKDKQKSHHKKEGKIHKTKKKNKHHGMIRPNVPPLLMNIEKESEPSITDVFAGQILKNHGITLDTSIDNIKMIETKPIVVNRSHFPIIDPATITSEPLDDTNSAPPNENIQTKLLRTQNDTSDDVPSLPEEVQNDDQSSTIEVQTNDPRLTLEIQTDDRSLPREVQIDEPSLPREVQIDVPSLPREIQTDVPSVPREAKIKEMNEIEAKIQGLKRKLVDQLDSISDDEDFLNIRTEAEELMNDFAEDVLQEITSAQPAKTEIVETPPLNLTTVSPVIVPPLKHATQTVEELPQIELQLPKRPVRDRLGVREVPAENTAKEKIVPEETEFDNAMDSEKQDSSERHTPDRSSTEKFPSVRSRLGVPVSLPQKEISSEDSSPDRSSPVLKRLTSKVSVLETRQSRLGPASIVRVRPRPRPTANAPASTLLLKAVAEAQKSLRNIPPKIDQEPQKIKRALVLPMRRGIEPQKIVIEVASDRLPSPLTSREHSDCEIDFDTESLADLESDVDNKSSKANNEFASVDNDYLPSRITRKLVNKALNYVSTNKTKEDQGLFNEEPIEIHNTTVDKEKGPQFVVTLDGLDPNIFLANKLKNEGLIDEHVNIEKCLSKEKHNPNKKKDNEVIVSNANNTEKPNEDKKKHSSDTSDDSGTQVIIKDEVNKKQVEKRKTEVGSDQNNEVSQPVKKRKSSPIVFDVPKKEKEIPSDSTGSDNNLTVTTANSHKYDTLPSLPAEKKSLPCRMFPACRYGASCAFIHPPCKFAASCTRRNCVYSHPVALKIAPIASHVVPVANYKTISTVAMPSMCKYYPNCVNPTCHYFHPKPCRYGKACINKLECNFYHHDLPITASSHKWKSPFKA